MTLTTQGAGLLYVEDGTGYENSDTLVSIDEATTYLLLFNKTSPWHTETDILVQAAALRRATFEWLETQFQGKWRGRIKQIDQRLSWPRIGAFDDEGRIVTDSAVPVQIKEAISLVAEAFLAGTAILANSVSTSGTLIEDTKKGAGFQKTQKWSSEGGNSSGLDQSIVRFRAAEGLIYPLLEGPDAHGIDGGVSATTAYHNRFF